MTKVVSCDDMFFKDDIKVIDAEVARPFNLPPLPIVSRDEFQVLYNGHIFVPVRENKPDALVKVYTRVYGLAEIESPKEQEDRYFSENKELIDKLKSDFIRRSIAGTDALENGSAVARSLQTAVCRGFAEKINNAYSTIDEKVRQPVPGKGMIPELDDGSVFNSYMNGCERIILVDARVYDLQTIPEYIATFENAIEPAFYQRLQKETGSATPEEVYKLLTENANKVGERKILTYMRDKIWCTERSFKLLLDGIYWIATYRDSADTLCSHYRMLIERKIKTEAVNELSGEKHAS